MYSLYSKGFVFSRLIVTPVLLTLIACPWILVHQSCWVDRRVQSLIGTGLESYFEAIKLDVDIFDAISMLIEFGHNVLRAQSSTLGPFL